MPVKVMIPSPLRPYAGKRDSAEFNVRTVGEALSRLTTEFADLRKQTAELLVRHAVGEWHRPPRRPLADHFFGDFC